MLLLGALVGNQQKQRDYSLFFDGVDDLVDIGKPLVPTTSDYTVITQFRVPLTVPAEINIWSEDISAVLKRHTFKYSNGNWIVAYFQNDPTGSGIELQTDTPFPLTSNSVVTVAVRRTGNSVDIIVNNTLVMRKSTTLYARVDNASHKIFCRRTWYGRADLYSHTIYSKSLSDAEIAAYQADSVYSSYVIAHYNTKRFYNPSVLIDSAKGNHGSIIGATWKGRG